MNPHTLELRCPHCDQKLHPFELPDNTGWQSDFHLACFNDDCPYYRRGWDWMMEQYKQKASYRFAVNPNSGATLMIPVWSDEATREMIVEADEGSNGGEGKGDEA